MANQPITNVQQLKFRTTDSLPQLNAYIQQLQNDNINLQKDVVLLSQRVSVLEQTIQSMTP